MTHSPDFAARMRERYPEGLTAIFAMGGTRMTYILENHRHAVDPGQMDMDRYGADMNRRTQGLIRMFMELGGQNLVIPLLSYQLFQHERGQEYAQITARLAHDLLTGSWVDFYRECEVDPYLAGIDTLLRFPEHTHAYELGQACERFNQTWPYREGRRKLIWEVAPIPLYSIWRAHEVMGEEARQRLEAELDAAPDLQVLHDTLYRYYARAVYGTEIPMPHVYLGTNRNGDVKLRAMLPIALTCGGPMRMFFTPYPTLFMTRDTLRAILEDAAFGKRLRSTDTDYAGKLSPDIVELEYQRVLELSANPWSTLGMVRRVDSDHLS